MRYNMKYRNNKHYMSLYSLLTTGDICGEQFCYHDIPEKLDPLDYDAFLANPTKLYVGCSNLDTGEAEYLECTDMRKPEDVNKVRASASLPLVSNIVEVDGMKLLDGGVSDSIPIFAFRRMGYRRNIVVLTRPEGYRKGPDKMLRLEAGRYREYPEFVKRCHMRHMYYNKTLDKLEELEKEGDTLIIRPSETIEISRLEKKPEMIEAMYGAHVFYEDGLEEIFPEIYDFAIAKQDFKAIGRPNLTDMQIGDDNIVTLTLTTEVYPEVTLGQYKGLEVEKEEVNVTDGQVQAELDRMAQNVASTETVERPAKMGDTANIDFEGFDNGVPFEGGKGDNFDLKLGSGQFVPGFEEQIVGMSAGEEKDIDITFPEDYHKELAGKAVVFHVKLNKVTETIVPEQDDEFAKDVSEFDTLDELKADIRAKALENAKKQADSAFEQAAVDKAAENTTVDMPKALVENELDIQMERFGYQLQMSGYSMEQYAKMMGGDVSTMRNAFRPAAEKQAKISVTLEKIAEVEGITASDEDIEAEFKSLAEQNGSDVVVEEWGNRKLAYPINYKTEGYYVLMTFVSGPAFPRELDRKLRIAEGVMRSLIVCKGE